MAPRNRFSSMVRRLLSWPCRRGSVETLAEEKPPEFGGMAPCPTPGTAVPKSQQARPRGRAAAAAVTKRGRLAPRLDGAGGTGADNELFEGGHRRPRIGAIGDDAKAAVQAIAIEVDRHITAMSAFEVAHVRIVGKDRGDQVVGRRVGSDRGPHELGGERR